jgi:hypothetical protein
MNADLKGTAEEIKAERAKMYKQLDSAMKVSPRQKISRAIDKTLLSQTGVGGWLRGITGAEFTPAQVSAAEKKGISVIEQQFRESGMINPDGTTDNGMLERAATRTLAEMSDEAKVEFAGDLLKASADSPDSTPEDIEESEAIKYLIKTEIEGRIRDLISKKEIGGSLAASTGRGIQSIGRGVGAVSEFVKKEAAMERPPAPAFTGSGFSPGPMTTFGYTPPEATATTEANKPTQRKIKRIGRDLKMRMY